MSCLSSFFMRKKTFEVKLIACNTRGCYSRNNRISTRETLHFQIILSTLSYEQKPRVTYSRGTRISDQGYIHTLFKHIYIILKFLMLIICMIRRHPSLYLIMLDEVATCSGIFSKYQVDILKCLYCSECHVIQISYWCRY